MLFRQFRLTSLVLSLAGLAACGDDSVGVVPSLFTGTYALQSVNGVPLPVTVGEGGGQRYILLADTLRFTADGRVRRITSYRHVSETWLPRDTIYTQTPTYEYRIQDRDLAFGFFEPCPDNANCIGIESGTITPSSVTLEGSLMWPGDPILEFRRLEER